MDGIINFDKPQGITSAKALYRVRSITGQRKSGHAGTLDPGATGVLVLCMGKATKLVEQLMDQPKAYRTIARLDITSDSFDSDFQTRPIAVASPPSPEDVASVLNSFEGNILQLPPVISALKVNGVPSYKRAARNEAVTLRERPVRIYWTQLVRYEWPEIEFEVACGRGTYIRSLIRDIGERLKTGGCLTSLVRTRVGPFSVEDGWSFDRLEQADSPASYLLPLEKAKQRLSEPIIVPEKPA